LCICCPQICSVLSERTSPPLLLFCICRPLSSISFHETSSQSKHTNSNTARTQTCLHFARLRSRTIARQQLKKVYTLDDDEATVHVLEGKMQVFHIPKNILKQALRNNMQQVMTPPPLLTAQSMWRTIRTRNSGKSIVPLPSASTYSKALWKNKGHPSQSYPSAISLVVQKQGNVTAHVIAQLRNHRR
jgi:hypothetical protein